MGETEYVNVGDGTTDSVAENYGWGVMEIITVGFFGLVFVVTPLIVHLSAWLPYWYEEFRQGQPKRGQKSTAKYRSL